MSGTGERRAPPESAPPPAPRRARWTTSRVIGIVFASIGGLIGLGLLAAGIAVIAAFAFGRDDDGYFNSDRKQLASATYAITTEEIDLGADEVDWAPEGILGTVRIRVDGGDDAVFVGIGADDDVDRYLDGVAHAELIDFDGDEPEFAPRDGSTRPAPPAEQEFWVAEAAGSGEQALTWDAEFGRWTVVVMNTDATRDVDVSADVGVKLDWAIWPGLGMFAAGLLMTIGAVAVLLLVGRPGTRGAAA